MLVVGRETPPGGIANREYGVAAYEVLDEETPAWGEIGDEELERLRIRAGTPRYGHELDDRVLPAEAGLDRTAIDFEKGCYPGQEPIARQHYRGRVNRTLRVLEIEGDELPEYDAELTYDGQGRRPGDERRRATASTSSRLPTSGSRFRGRGATARGARRNPARLRLPAPVAQGIERCPAEAEVACSNLAGRTHENPAGLGFSLRRCRRVSRRFNPPPEVVDPASPRRCGTLARHRYTAARGDCAARRASSTLSTIRATARRSGRSAQKIGSAPITAPRDTSVAPRAGALRSNRSPVSDQ